LSVWPPDVAAWVKKRFGHVGPGTEENQWSQTAYSCASAVSVGMFAESWQRMTCIAVFTSCVTCA
jgi:hypothetical protein